MPVLDLFSKRQRRLRGDVPDVYEYDQLPPTLRVQVIHILRDALGGKPRASEGTAKSWKCYETIVNTLCREYGVFYLGREPRQRSRERDWSNELFDFLLQEKEVDRVLDAIEISFRIVDIYSRSFEFMNRRNANEIADASLAELNVRFREHGIGFQFEGHEIVRVDSQFVHEEAVKPVLRVLSGQRYAGAQDEFLRAYGHYRNHRGKEAINDALKAFESTLKVICARRKWIVEEHATSKALIDAAYQNGLIPVFWQTSMSGLRSVLENGIPTGRNRLSGHGQGEQPTEVPDHIVAYVLHLTASAVLFLARSDEALG
jgi:hypothetical protein